MAFFAKFRRKLRTMNFEAHFQRKLRTLEKCSNVKKVRTTEPQPIFTGSYKKKVYLFLKLLIMSNVWGGGLIAHKGLHAIMFYKLTIYLLVFVLYLIYNI